MLAPRDRVMPTQQQYGCCTRGLDVTEGSYYSSHIIVIPRERQHTHARMISKNLVQKRRNSIQQRKTHDTKTITSSSSSSSSRSVRLIRLKDILSSTRGKLTAAQVPGTWRTTAPLGNYYTLRDEAIKSQKNKRSRTAPNNVAAFKKGVITCVSPDFNTSDIMAFFQRAIAYLSQGSEHPAQADVAYRDDGLHWEDACPRRSVFCGCCKEIGRLCCGRRTTQCVKLETCRPGKPTSSSLRVPV